MITRGIQRCSFGTQSVAEYQKVLFQKPIQEWTINRSTYPKISYSNGTFTIPKASASDYIVTWEISVSTATKIDTIDNCYMLSINYSTGALTAGSIYSSVTSTGIIIGYKILHIKSKSTTDILSMSLVNTCFYSTSYLTVPSPNLSTSLSANDIYNANICIFSI